MLDRFGIGVGWVLDRNWMRRGRFFELPLEMMWEYVLLCVQCDKYKQGWPAGWPARIRRGSGVILRCRGPGPEPGNPLFLINLNSAALGLSMSLTRPILSLVGLVLLVLELDWFVNNCQSMSFQ